jgi:hypothetical protein
VAESIVVDARPEAVFDLLADPRAHPLFDGSGTVRGSGAGPRRLCQGARFSMTMRLVAPYRIVNTVVEFEENRRIAWRHFAGHRWRYELEPVDGGTKVTETWDPTPLPGYSWPIVARLRFPERNAAGISATLRRLKILAESR